tara:strand:+ start:838 stop:1353 length:516 start_codon:yes stop_codon:yes gene_type:complete
MDISTNEVNQITLEYLTNARQYDKYMKERSSKIQEQFNKDKRFYRKRIHQLTKDLLQDKVVNIPSNLKKCYKGYLEECILYFKTIDTTDILQDEYKNVLVDDCDSTTNTKSLDEINQLLVNEKPPENKIEDCMNIKKIKGVKETVILPRKRDVDLKNPTLKKKGVRNKNNE